MKRFRIALMLVAVALVFETSVASAAPAASPDARLSDRQRAEIVEAVTEILNESYVFADVAARMGRLIENKLEAGQYDGLEILVELTDQLTEDLRSDSQDLHLSVGPLHESAQEDPEEEAAIRARQLEGMRRENYGFRKVEVRAGNMGYLRLAGFRAIKGVVSGTVRDEEP